MATFAADIKARVRDDWTRDTTVNGWRKHRESFGDATREISNLFVTAGEITAGMKVLDLASGSGEPATTIARAVGPTGHVTATDLSSEMLQIAEDFAVKYGITNMSFTPADMEELPFPDASFDRVTCRWGIMFVPGHVKALKEMLRVLKPGGKVVQMVWAAPEQPFFAVPQGLVKLGAVPAPDGNAITPFRFAQPGSLSSAMREAGFRNVTEKECRMPMDWQGSAKSLWEYFYDIAGNFRQAIDSLDAATRAQLIQETLSKWRPYENGPYIHIGARIHIAVAERA